MNRRTLILTGFISLLFIGALVWAKSSDPFQRIEFSVKIKDGNTGGIIVLPKPERMCPVIVYLHGTGGSCLTDGRELRQWAELGFAAVGFDYNQTNYAVFERQFSAVLEHVRQQPWAMADHVTWIGYSSCL